MSRSAADATRFTATGPYASAKIHGAASPSFTPSAPSKNGPANGPGSSRRPNETPKQKVERLRAEARAAKMAKDFSLMDRIIGSGRVWADRLHRGAVYTLIAASGIAGALTIYSASSLVVYNRRQRALWIDRELQKLFDARKAYVEGNASLEQLELLQREKEADEANARYQEEKKQKYSYKVRQWIFGSAGLKNEEASAEPVEKPYADAGEGKPTLMEAINAKRLEIERGVVPGAPTSTPAAEEQQPQKKSWTSWLTGR